MVDQLIGITHRVKCKIFPLIFEQNLSQVYKWTFRKWEEVVGIGWSWLRIWRGSGHL
jgi:hypothetical protein